MLPYAAQVLASHYVCINGVMVRTTGRMAPLVIGVASRQETSPTAQAQALINQRDALAVPTDTRP